MYRNNAETAYLNSDSELSEYLKNEINNPDSETVSIDWKNIT